MNSLRPWAPGTSRSNLGGIQGLRACRGSGKGAQCLWGHCHSQDSLAGLGYKVPKKPLWWLSGPGTGISGEFWVQIPVLALSPLSRDIRCRWQPRKTRRRATGETQAAPPALYPPPVSRRALGDPEDPPSRLDRQRLEPRSWACRQRLTSGAWSPGQRRLQRKRVHSTRALLHTLSRHWDLSWEAGSLGEPVGSTPAPGAREVCVSHKGRMTRGRSRLFRWV